ncbi:hypothetical protein ACRQ1B_12710 [Rhizobium panacihumi]|uniref:hypothetical protein n=1 Tax=Rhizobium panacihumi TaxID=2008450 RepID=UPI003D7B0EF6
MQIHGSYSQNSYYGASKAQKTDANSSTDSSKNDAPPSLEDMLDNLREDPSVGDRITENDDGTYSFDMRAQGWSDKTFAARAIVTELNGSKLTETDGAIYPSASDMDLFKQMTGYNMFILGGFTVALDDNGFPPSAEDQKMVQQAMDFINNVASQRDAGYLDGELTSENVGDLLASYNIGAGSNSFVDDLLEVLGKASPQQALAQEQKPVDELLNMISL